MSRIWKYVIYICEYWLVLFLALPSQDFFSLSPTRCLVDCAVCLVGVEIIRFAFIPFSPGNTVGREKRVVNIKENSAARLNRGKTGHLVCMKSMKGDIAAQ